MKNISKLVFCQLIFIFVFSQALADTIKLKNGRSVEGIIKAEDGERVELEVGSGTVKFLKSEIADISRSSGSELSSLRERWKKNKLELDNRLARQRSAEENKPRRAGFTQNAKGMTIGVTLNNKVETEMVLDTGASLVLITRNVARRLGINLERLKPDMSVLVADGRSVPAARIILDRVKVENSEVRNVAASVLMDERGDLGFGDGLLGMSFLRNFNFKIDQKENKLILEKL
jgi:clan AA aspartic protease (TIGR02281 family)